MPETNFGSCCKDLKDAMTTPPNSFFRVEKDNGVLYLLWVMFRRSNVPVGLIRPSFSTRFAGAIFKILE